MDEKKPCPWCGGQDMTMIVNDLFAMNVEAWITCRKCLASGPYVRGMSKNQVVRKAKRRWNKRADTDSEAGVLKPCPFCGGQAVARWEEERFVECRECGAASGFYKRMDEAIFAWNRRPDNDT